MTVPLADPNTEDCRAISSILARVGDKWTVLIVVLLGDGPKRFNEIKRMVGGISQRMLTFTLRLGARRAGDTDGLPHRAAAGGLRIDQARQHLVEGGGTARFVGACACERDPGVAGAVRREEGG
jgi:HxlR-like helix-turn-helix